jgi:hypothetical protein
MGIYGFAQSPYKRLTQLSLISLFFIAIAYNSKLAFYYNHQSSNEKSFVYFWLNITIIASVIGIVFTNFSVYFFTDFLYIFIGFLSFLAVYHVFQAHAHANTGQIGWRKAHTATLIIIILLSLWLTPKLPNPSILLIIMFYLLFTNRFWAFITTSFIAIILNPDLNRAFLAVYLLLFTLYIFSATSFSIKTKLSILSTSLLFFIIILPATLESLLASQLITNTNLLNRLNGLYELFSFTDITELSIPILQRIIEAKLVLQAWLQTPVTFLFGLGSGATINNADMVDTTVSSNALLGGGAIHNIHILPFALIFKYGLLGIVLFVWLTLIIYRSVVELLKNQRLTDIETISHLTVISIFIFALPASNYLWSTPLFWIALGMLVAHKQSRKSQM